MPILPLQNGYRIVTAVLGTAILLTVFGIPAAASAHVENSSAAPVTAAGPFASSIDEAAQRFGIPATWIQAVMQAESGADPRATSPKGAMGLMQIMPATWEDLRRRHHLGDDSYNPHDNILAGAAFLRELHDHYGSPGFLAAYNAGPGRFENHLATGEELPEETQRYVATLLPRLGQSLASNPVLTALAPHPWTDAPLFVGSIASGRSVGLAPLTVQASVFRPAPRLLSSGLFVALSMRGSAR